MNSAATPHLGGKGTHHVGVKTEMDDMVRRMMVLSDGSEGKFLEFVENLEIWLSDRMSHKKEVTQLQAELIKSQTEVTRLEKKLNNAQHLLGQEKEKRGSLEHQMKQIFQLMEGLKKGRQSGDETQDRLLSLLSSTQEHGGVLGVPLSEGRYRGGSHGGLDSLLSPRPHLSTIDESADTLDAVSDIDLTEGDDLEVSSLVLRDQHSPARRSGQKRRSCSPPAEQDLPPSRVKQARHQQPCYEEKTPAPLTTTVTSSFSSYQPSAPPLCPDDWVRTPNRRQAPLPPTPQRSTPQSQYSTPPQGSPLLRNLSRVQNRPHCFYTKNIYMTEHCQPCGKRIKFGKVVLKCRDCRAVCHQDCRDAVPLPCVATVATPGNKHHMGGIADYTPNVAPMVPALIVHCTIEVEHRGVAEVGIYRVSALERDIKELKEKFLRGKGLPNLTNIDIHTICGTVKHFIRSLKEPLVSHTLWQQFASASNMKEEADCEASLYQAIAELPQPNRDTLAWMILHLQRMSEAKECLMTTENLARMFGPTLVGYSVTDPEPEMILMQTADQQTVMTKLLAINRDYWESFTNENLFSGSLTVGGDGDHFHTPIMGDAAPVANRRRSLISRTPLK